MLWPKASPLDLDFGLCARAKLFNQTYKSSKTYPTYQIIKNKKYTYIFRIYCDITYLILQGLGVGQATVTERGSKHHAEQYYQCLLKFANICFSTWYTDKNINTLKTNQLSRISTECLHVILIGIWTSSQKYIVFHDQFIQFI